MSGTVQAVSQPRSQTGPQPTAAESRAARARAALARAEERTGARRVDLQVRSSVASAAPAVSLITSERPPMAVPPPLQPLLPEGLRRGEVTVVLGSTGLAIALLAHACAEGAWAVALGYSSFGVLAAAQAGLRLDRFALVPRPGAQAGAVLGALLDGVGVVLVGPQVVLPGPDARRLTARVRERGAVLLATIPWPGAQLVLTARPVAGSGAERGGGPGAGTGRVRGVELHVGRSGRAGAGVPAGLDVRLPMVGPVVGPRPAAPVPAPTLRLVG